MQKINRKQYSASSPFPFSRHCEQSEAREGTVLHCKAKLHKYHIGIISLLTTFGNTDFYKNLRKARAVNRWPSLWGKVGMGPLLHHLFI